MEDKDDWIHAAQVEDEVVSEAKVMNQDGSDDGQADRSDLLDRLFKAFTRRLPDESLATRSNLAMVAYEEFYMWANNMTREEYETADVVTSHGDTDDNG